jgi:transcriptional regulator with XRE-family HTH domain
MQYLREKRGITREQFAEMVGTTVTTIGGFERGAADVNLKTLDYWLTVLGGRCLVIPFV